MAIKARIIGLKRIRQRLANRKLGPLTRAVHSKLEVIWRNAGEAFVRAAMTHVLVETGMSAASFFPLSRANLSQGAQVAISNRISTRKRESRSGIPQFPDGKRLKGTRVSANAGIRAGREAFKFNTGSPTRPVFSFQFITTVWQLAYHELNQRSLDIGLEAFNHIIQRDFAPIMRTTLKKFLIARRGAARITSNG